MTKAATGAVNNDTTVEPVARSFVTLLLMSFVPLFWTNVVALPVRNQDSYQRPGRKPCTSCRA